MRVVESWDDQLGVTTTRPAAYGWPVDIPDDAALADLLARNGGLAGP